jgi:Yippee zinc-binding/DNA-binding /Mis18, centromere assembly
MKLSPSTLFRHIRTGVHSVADAFCLGCNERLGWFYHKAADNLQKYKEGMFLVRLFFPLSGLSKSGQENTF